MSLYQVWLKTHSLFFVERLRSKRSTKNKLGSYT